MFRPSSCRDLPGVSVGKPEKKMGQQGAHIHDVMFDNVKVPVENRLARRARGSASPCRCLIALFALFSSVCVGVAERLIEESVRYAAERKVAKRSRASR